MVNDAEKACLLEGCKVEETTAGVVVLGTATRCGATLFLVRGRERCISHDEQSCLLASLGISMLYSCRKKGEQADKSEMQRDRAISDSEQMSWTDANGD